MSSGSYSRLKLVVCPNHGMQFCGCYRPPERGAMSDKTPPRGELPADIEKAARLISPSVWRGPYKAGEGPMHFAGGSYWHDELLRRADVWERQAAAARVCAEFLPDA